MSIEFSETNRGFAIGTFLDCYGRSCSIQKSSLATADCLWLGCDDVINPPEGGPPLNARMHLNQDMAAELIPFLERFVETGELVPHPGEPAPDPQDAVVAAARVLFHEHYHGNVRTENVAWGSLREALNRLGR